MRVKFRRFLRVQFLLYIFFLPACAFSQDCYDYDKPVLLKGRIVHRDESGYASYLAIRLDDPICTHAKAGDAYSESYNNVKIVQIYAITENEIYNQRLSKHFRLLEGQNVTLKGMLWQAMTGYQRTDVVISVDEIAAIDAAGRKALLRKEITPVLKKPYRYEATINAGQRMTILAFDMKNGKALAPAEAYAPSWMTGGQVEYFSCMKGYAMSEGRLDGENCFSPDDPLSCAFSAFPKNPVTLKLVCTRTGE